MSSSQASVKSIVGPAVQGHDVFDRETERASLAEMLRDGAHVLVTAPRRTAKTSRLRQVALALSGTIDHLFIDVEGGHTAADFIVAPTTAAHEKAAVWGPLRSFLARPFLLTERLDEVKIDEVSIQLRDALQTNGRPQGDQFLRDLADHGELVIIIDERPILLNRLLTEEGDITCEGVRRVDEVMPWLRAACKAHQGRLRFVFCGSIGLGPVLRRAGPSATINHLTPLHLDPWSPEDAAAFLGRVAETYGLAWGPGAIHRIVERAMLASHSRAHLTQYEERLTDVLTARRVPLALDLRTEPPDVRAALHVLLGGFDAAFDARRVAGTVHPAKPDHLAVLSALPIGLARAGRARDLLDALADTPFATDRNPWFVALDVVAGTPVRAPREVREAAAELAERMRPPTRTAPARSKGPRAGVSPFRRT